MIESFALLGLLVFFGYLLGIIGFFRAGAAKREIGQLRALLAQETARRAAAEQAPGPQPGPQQPETPRPEAPRPAAPEPAEPPILTGRPRPPSAQPRSIASGAQRRAARGPRPDLESILTMRWGAWGGAVALLLAGVFLVRYAAEQGLLGPATRCGAAALLGATLLAAAEWLRRRDVPAVEGEFAIDQAPPALAAGGIAVLFGAAYGAGPFYDLLSPLVAFALMAVVSFVGMAAALRFGPLTAAVGIVGAFVAPALVQTPSPSLIGLFAYLALATAAAYEVVWRTAWIWLGFAVAIAGAIWLLIAAVFMVPSPQVWAAAIYVPIAAFLGLLLPDAAVEDGRGRALAFGQLAIVAAAGLVLEAAAPGAATRLALFALTPLAIWKGAEAPPLDRLPWLAAAAGLGALLLWDGFDIDWAAPVDTSTFLLAAFAFAAVVAIVGLVLERRAPNAVRWSALAAVPVLVLAAAYARVGRLAPDPTWGLAGLLLAFALVAATRRAVAADAQPSAGAHAAGAVAALALAFGMTLRDAWLTDALAAILPGLAWIEARVPLPALRKVALVVASITLLLLWRWLVDDTTPLTGTLPAGAFATYAIPALAFLAAARMFRKQGDDTTVATLEAGAIGLGALYVTLQIRMWFGQGRIDAPFGFDEAATIMLAAAAQAFAYDRIAARAPRRTVKVASVLLAGVAAVIAIGLLLANPMIVEERVSTVSLVIAYLVPAIAAGIAARMPRRTPALSKALAGYAVVAGFAWTTLQVRHAFHPDAMGIDGTAPVGDAELWAWSGAWLAYGLVMMIVGIWLQVRPLRMAALALIGLVCLKVVFWDMADLTGLWRVASFLGLGLALIGLAAMHRRFVLPRQAEEAAS